MLQIEIGFSLCIPNNWKLSVNLLMYAAVQAGLDD